MTHRTQITAAILALALAPAATGAQSWPPSAWSFSGNLAAGVQGGEADDSLRAFSDLWLDVPVLRGAGIGLGFGLYGQTDDGRWKHETYAAVTWSTAIGTLAAGVQRPAYDLFVASGLERLLPLAARNQRQLAFTRSRLTWGAMYDGYLPYGATWASAPADGLRWAVSAHRIDNRDIDAGSAGIELDRDDWLVSAAFETASDGRSGGKAQLARDFGGGRAGFSYYDSPAPGFGEMLEGFASWNVAQRTEVGVVVQDRLRGSDLAALGVRHGFRRGDSVALGVTRDSGDTVVSLGYDWSF